MEFDDRTGFSAEKDISVRISETPFVPPPVISIEIDTALETNSTEEIEEEEV